MLLLAALVMFVAWPAYQQERRIRAAWERVGACEAVSDTSPTVRCNGVELVALTLPPSFAACIEIRPLNDGQCVVRINAEAAPDFTRAVARVAALGLGRHVTSFGTVNRRRCKDTRTGNFIRGCISKHSYGIAADVRDFADNANWDDVVRREPGVQQMIDVFREEGFRWGMTFSNNPDPQHVEWQPR
jgi:hypothetical protein